MSSGLERLRKNINGYFGEGIDINRVLQECLASAEQFGWKAEWLNAAPKPDLLTLTRTARRANSPALYISAGIHGDEPAGPLAVAQMLRENTWPEAFNLFLCPCLNPTGFFLNRRENSEGTDLNRQYLQPKAEETLAHIQWLKMQPHFDLCFCLHEDWESEGFYLYELNPDNQPSLAPIMIEQVAQVCPIDRSEIIEGRPAKDGIVRPSVDPRSRPLWPEAFFLLTNKTRLTYTLEAPSDFPLNLRATALVTAVRAAIDVLAARGGE